MAFIVYGKGGSNGTFCFAQDKREVREDNLPNKQTVPRKDEAHDHDVQTGRRGNP
jgi:hypothetical protein